MKKTKEILKELLSIPSPSGCTDMATKWVASWIADRGFAYRTTSKGAIIADCGGEGSPLILTAHLDTLGAMVTSVKKNGRMKITRIGSYPFYFLEGVNGWILCRKSGSRISGTFQATNPSVHVNKKINDEKRTEKNLEFVPDIITSSDKESELHGISQGDFIAIDPSTQFTSTGFIKSRHLDDKAGVAILLSLAEKIKHEHQKLGRKVYLCFSTYEEVGHGAIAGLPEAEEMISVDMGAVGEGLLTDEQKVSICFKDSSGPYDYRITEKLRQIAEKRKLNWAFDHFPNYSSDSSAALKAGWDMRQGLVGPGISASHGYERAHIDGLKNCLNLLWYYILLPLEGE